MNSPQIPDAATRARSIDNLRRTSREMAEFDRELAEIEARLDSPRRRSANANYLTRK
jgi:hypothetical protein